MLHALLLEDACALNVNRTRPSLPPPLLPSLHSYFFLVTTPPVPFMRSLDRDTFGATWRLARFSARVDGGWSSLWLVAVNNGRRCTPPRLSHLCASLLKYLFVLLPPYTLYCYCCCSACVRARVWGGDAHACPYLFAPSLSWRLSAKSRSTRYRPMFLFHHPTVSFFSPFTLCVSYNMSQYNFVKHLINPKKSKSNGGNFNRSWVVSPLRILERFLARIMHVLLSTKLIYHV